MSDLAVDLATLGFVAVLVMLTWGVARSMRAQLASRPSGLPEIVVTSAGRLEGLVISVDKPVTIGRSAAADVAIVDDYASDLHARVEPQGGSLRVVDLDSTNGTFVNERPVTAPVPLRRGDTLRIGRTIMEVR